MKLFVATDINVVISDGKILANGKHSTILRRYYEAFGPIVLCARYATLDGDLKGLNDISDIVCSVVEIGSLFSMLLGKCNKKMQNAMKDCDLVVGRCPSISAYKAFDIAKKLKIPYFAESMGCAWDAYFNHGVQGKIVAPYMFFKMKKVVKKADYALYVTSEFLQKRYPCKNESVSASNVLISALDEKALENRIEKLKSDAGSKEITLMTTAAVNVRYKGQQYVINAIPKLNQLGFKVRYVLIGEGDDSYLRTLANSLGVSSQVEFKGRLPLEEVFTLLDEADLYIQPSLQEGLPRSVIEAMSRACACAGAKTAGIPELIEKRFVVRRKSVKDIVNVVKEYSNLTIEEKIEIAKRNFNEAGKYEANILDERRNAYYQKIKSELQNN